MFLNLVRLLDSLMTTNLFYMLITLYNLFHAFD